MYCGTKSTQGVDLVILKPVTILAVSIKLVLMNTQISDSDVSTFNTTNISFHNTYASDTNVDHMLAGR